MFLLTAVRRWRRRLSTLSRLLDHLETTLATDRDLISTILAALGPIAEGVAAKDTRIRELEQQLAAAGAAAAADEAADTAALAPVAEAVQALRDALAPRVDVEPVPIPVEEVPAAVEDLPADGPVDPPVSDGEAPSGPDTVEQPTT